jgi:signal transduction histidine kinase
MLDVAARVTKPRVGIRRPAWLSRYGSASLLARFGLLSLVPVVGLGVVLGQMLTWTVTQRAYESAEQRAQLLAQLAVRPLFTPADMSGGIPSDQLDVIDARLQKVAGSPSEQFTVWNRDGAIVYSAQRSQIGTSPPMPAGVHNALTGQNYMADGPDRIPSATHTGGGPLIFSVYVPLRLEAEGAPDGAIEIFLPYDQLAAQIEADTHRLYGILLAGLALLYAIMFPIVFTSYRSRVTAMEKEAQALREHNVAEEAIRGSEAKSRFLASMSHEVRTPLNSILGFAQLLLEEKGFGPLTERQRRYVGHISSSGQHLLSLINDILDLSKVQAGQMDLSVEDVRVRAVVGEVVALARPLADGKGLDLVMEEGPDGVIRADGRRLQQVLWNLLSNAIKFTPEGAVTVRVATTRTQARISVADTGVGIRYEDQSRIFDEFTQLNAQGGRVQEGTGLGLALTRQLVEVMGGRIALESTPKVGSTFTVTLPLAPARSQTVRGEAIGRAV